MKSAFILFTSFFRVIRHSYFSFIENKIKNLVNEEKPAGNYEVEFNRSNLPSGIYFYRIETSKFSDTKKFVLLK
jgi:hypothetical protein